MPVNAKIKKLIADNKEKHLDLSQWLKDEDIKELQELLVGNTAVESIDLSCNNLTDDAAEYIALLTVPKIDLSENRLGDEGLKVIITNLNITDLNVSDNGLTDASAEVLRKNVSRYGAFKFGRNPRISDELKHELYILFGLIPPFTPFSPKEPPIGIDLSTHYTSPLSNPGSRVFPLVDEEKLDSGVNKSNKSKLGSEIYKQHEEQFENMDSATMALFLRSLVSLCPSVNLEKLKLVDKAPASDLTRHTLFSKPS